MLSESPIGVYDSGVGGLSVLRAIRDALPHEPLLYVADSAHVPYGEKTQAFVERRACAIADYFVSQGARAMVVACNTATAAAIALLRKRHPELIIIGVEPAIKPAAHLTHSGVVGVFATTGTLASPKFAALVQREAPEVRILLRPCPEWVRLVEQGVVSGPEAAEAVRAPVAELREAGADVLVLGCTHFPFLRDAIQDAAGPGVPLLETGAPVSRWLRHQLQERGMLVEHGSGSLHLHTTGDAPALARLASQLLGTAMTADTVPDAWRGTSSA
ncbi:glutamate racemase [Achromobacter spanius]|uniref:Glutamate racemase n=1 Tax=Achromobacter spanius TaxID=217203 RepID=A0A2S0IC16_9BURK|nr:glutamate racemase [Achromobacter spanius]AVJ29585.1 glutamate racemase [Achromobacter spanius]